MFAAENSISIRRRDGIVVLSLLLIPLWYSGCKRNDSSSAADDATADGDTGGATQIEEPSAQLVFPESLKVEDQTVNQVLTEAMTLCTSGDYESFRSIWSAAETPMSEDRFEQMRLALSEIRILALEKAVLRRNDESGGKTVQDVYVAFAEMQLDTEQLTQRYPGAQGTGKNRIEPQREAVLMLVQEFGTWRLAHAPDQMRTWLKSQVPDRG
ncbi:MAG: hypothetical protein ACYTHJ_10665 [Planctomycetota bacterium]|jgi:hypothetical protein